ncbi:MAG: hypothetical protein B7Z13_11175 [Caulobacterales bacterium 32-67-6]|nr:MAG: hypothetical protein B7Z13_11175 [Caulobacterales bacterium 32-67-6]
MNLIVLGILEAFCLWFQPRLDRIFGILAASPPFRPIFKWLRRQPLWAKTLVILVMIPVLSAAIPLAILAVILVLVWMLQRV